MKINRIKKGFSRWTIIIIIIILLSIFYFSFETEESYQESVKIRSIENDGFCVLYNPQYSIQTITRPCSQLEKDALSRLPEGYEFIDYIYKINNVALSTFHRDVTSSKHNYNTKYPVYTLILYKYDGELLSVCPRSNATYPFVWSNIVNIHGKSGTAFLFDCDLLHAGRINNCQDREVIQYKIAHRGDMPKLAHLHGIRNEKTDICKLSYYNMIMRKLSYYFEMPINYIFYPIMIKRENADTILGKIQSYIPITYYNNA